LEAEIAEALLEAETLEMNELKVAYDNAKGKEKASIK